MKISAEDYNWLIAFDNIYTPLPLTTQHELNLISMYRYRNIQTSALAVAYSDEEKA